MDAKPPPKKPPILFFPTTIHSHPHSHSYLPLYSFPYSDSYPTYLPVCLSIYLSILLLSHPNPSHLIPSARETKPRPSTSTTRLGTSRLPSWVVAVRLLHRVPTSAIRTTGLLLFVPPSLGFHHRCSLSSSSSSPFFPFLFLNIPLRPEASCTLIYNGIPILLDLDLAHQSEPTRRVRKGEPPPPSIILASYLLRICWAPPLSHRIGKREPLVGYSIFRFFFFVTMNVLVSQHPPLFPHQHEPARRSPTRSSKHSKAP